MATEQHRELSAEASSVLPEPADYRLGSGRYLEQIRKIRAAVNVPVIASLNGTTTGGWIDFARLIEQAGASALELNLYAVPDGPSSRRGGGRAGHAGPGPDAQEPGEDSRSP